MNKFVKSLAALGLLAGASIANACQLTAWTSANGGIASGGPLEATNQPRYSGLCAAQASATGDFVLTNAPADETTIIQRFYFRAVGAGNATIYQLYSDDAGTTPVATVTYDGTNVTVTANDGGTSASAPAAVGQWNSVEFSFNQNADGFLWVNSDATTDPADGTFTSGAASTVASAALGGIDMGGFTTLGVDALVTRRSSAIGRLLLGDSNGNGSLSVADAVTALNEALNAASASLNTGQPDFNEDGNITVGDAVAILNAFLNP